MAEYSYELKIPLARVAVVIGKGGKVKKDIEDATGTKASKRGFVCRRHPDGTTTREQRASGANAGRND